MFGDVLVQLTPVVGKHSLVNLLTVSYPYSAVVVAPAAVVATFVGLPRVSRVMSYPSRTADAVEWVSDVSCPAADRLGIVYCANGMGRSADTQLRR